MFIVCKTILTIISQQRYIFIFYFKYSQAKSLLKKYKQLVEHSIKKHIKN